MYEVTVYGYSTFSGLLGVGPSVVKTRVYRWRWLARLVALPYNMPTFTPGFLHWAVVQRARPKLRLVHNG